MIFTSKKALLMVWILTFLIVGCEKENVGDINPIDQTNVVGTLTMWVGDPNLNTRELEKQLKKKYPNLILYYNYFNPPNYPGKKLEDLIETGEVPDIILADSSKIVQLLKNNLLDDMDFFAENNLHLEDFNSAIIENIRSYNGSIVAIPYSKNIYALFYNKDIFDNHSIPYPKDGMTWDEVISLAEEVGVKSQGSFMALDIVQPELLFSQLSLNVIDPESKKANFSTNEWNSLVNMMKEISYIPSNDHEAYYKDRLWYSGFSRFDLGHVAMTIGGLEGNSGFIRTSTLFHRKDKINWDVVSFPVFGKNMVGPAPSYSFLGVNPGSERKKEAYQVISYLVSHEIQLENSMNSRASILTDSAIQNKFGSNHYILKSKHLDSFFINTDATPRNATYEDDEFIYLINYRLASLIENKNSVASEVLNGLSEGINKNTARLHSSTE